MPRKPLLPAALAGLALPRDNSKSQELVAKPLWLIFHLFLPFHKPSIHALVSTETRREKEGCRSEEFFEEQVFSHLQGKKYMLRGLMNSPCSR